MADTIEVMLIRQLADQNADCRWVSTAIMIADCLTKAMESTFLRNILQLGQFAYTTNSGLFKLMRIKNLVNDGFHLIRVQIQKEKIMSVKAMIILKIPSTLNLTINDDSSILWWLRPLKGEVGRGFEPAEREKVLAWPLAGLPSDLGEIFGGLAPFAVSVLTSCWLT